MFPLPSELHFLPVLPISGTTQQKSGKESDISSIHLSAADVNRQGHFKSIPSYHFLHSHHGLFTTTAVAKLAPMSAHWCPPRSCLPSASLKLRSPSGNGKTASHSMIRPAACSCVPRGSAPNLPLPAYACLPSLRLTPGHTRQEVLPRRGQ